MTGQVARAPGRPRSAWQSTLAAVASLIMAIGTLLFTGTTTARADDAHELTYSLATVDRGAAEPAAWQVAAMAEWRFAQYFAFDTDCQGQLKPGAKCMLKYYGTENPVQATDVYTTGFRLVSLPGHSEGAGRAIVFWIERTDTELLLHVRADGPWSLSEWLTYNTPVAKIIWDQYAKNLSYGIAHGEWHQWAYPDGFLDHLDSQCRYPVDLSRNAYIPCEMGHIYWPWQYGPPDDQNTWGCAAHGTAVSPAANRAIDAACSQVAAGTWYSWGGGHGGSPGASYGWVDQSDPERSKNDPYRKGFDCSGLVRWAWSQAVGYDVMGNTTAAGIYSLPGQRLGTDTSALSPGDIVFWGRRSVHHVAIYLGAGKIVEARESDTHVMVSDLNSHDMGDYAGGLRFMGGMGSGNHMTWGTGINVRSAAARSASVVTTFPGPTAVNIDCQKHAESVTAEGITNDVWSHLPDLGGWISNNYVKGPYWLDGVPDCGGSTGSGEHSTWGDSVNVRSTPSRSGSVVTTFSAPTAIHIDCQKHAESVTAEGITNDAWSHLPDVGGWVSNIFVKGAAWLDGVPDCGGGTSPGSNSTWGTDVNTHAHPSTTSDVKSTFSGPTPVKIGCQKHAQSVTAEGVTNDVWSYLPDYGAWISNIYLKGPAWLDGVMDCTRPPALDPDTGTGGGTSAGADGMFSTWGTGVNTHARPYVTSDVKNTFSGPTQVRIGCQKHAQSVTAEGVTNDVWSYLPDYKAWISNIYLKGPAWLDRVIDCTRPPALDPETRA
ncbi:NlpC/P60 family protein [Streptomyces sp. NPDC059070]|uniref:NlpC/P60 family protein n=1 Tax=Streptomyces sp. NPDC059070 TaxID=3346713 RepID=UPI0036AF4674